MNNPLISLVLATKNAMPHLKNAIENIRKQKYRNFELIVQDGASTDGTVEFLQTITDLPRIEIVSEPDIGIGQAYNRGILRSKGDLICFTAADECLFEDSLERGVAWFEEHPLAATIYGGMALVDQHGRIIRELFQPPFDFLKYIKCQIWSPTTGLLNKKVLGKELYYDESVKAHPDYEFWLRVGSRFSANEIINRRELFAKALCDRTSMSYRTECFEQCCKDRFVILDKFLSTQEQTPALEVLRKDAKESILSWAIKEIIQIEGPSCQAIKLYEKAIEMEESPPNDICLVKGAISLNSFKKISLWSKIYTYGKNYFINQLSKFRYLFTSQMFKNSPLAPSTEQVVNRLSINLICRLLLKSLNTHSTFNSNSNKICIMGGPGSWSYISQTNFNTTADSSEKCKYWLKVHLKVLSGTIGVCLCNGNKIEKDKIFPVYPKEITTFISIDQISDLTLIIRNGGQPNSVVEIFDISLYKEAPILIKSSS